VAITSRQIGGLEANFWRLALARRAYRRQRRDWADNFPVNN
jgi:hypothetical protein